MGSNPSTPASRSKGNNEVVPRSPKASFAYAEQRNVATAKAAPEDAGDAWTWTAIDADTRPIISYPVGKRDSEGPLACRIGF